MPLFVVFMEAEWNFMTPVWNQKKKVWLVSKTSYIHSDMLLICIIDFLLQLMQLSMGTLNSPSSRVIKDSTPSCWILRCINFGIGESSPNLFLNMMNFYLVNLKHSESWTNGHFIVLLFCLFESDSDYKSAWWIFTHLYFCGGESWPNGNKKSEMMVNLDLTILLKRWTEMKTWGG